MISFCRKADNIDHLNKNPEQGQKYKKNYKNISRPCCNRLLRTGEQMYTLHTSINSKDPNKVVYNCNKLSFVLLHCLKFQKLQSLW